MLVAHAVVCSHQPSFEVGKDKMDNWQKFFGNTGIAAFRDGHVIVAHPVEPGVSGPVVSHDLGRRLDDAFDEAAERYGASVWDNGKTHSSGDTTSVTLGLGGIGSALAHLDCGGHNDLVMDATPLSASSPPD